MNEVYECVPNNTKSQNYNKARVKRTAKLHDRNHYSDYIDDAIGKITVNYPVFVSMTVFFFFKPHCLKTS